MIKGTAGLVYSPADRMTAGMTVELEAPSTCVFAACAFASRRGMLPSTAVGFPKGARVDVRLAIRVREEPSRPRQLRCSRGRRRVCGHVYAAQAARARVIGTGL